MVFHDFPWFCVGLPEDPIPLQQLCCEAGGWCEARGDRKPRRADDGGCHREPWLPAEVGKP